MKFTITTAVLQDMLAKSTKCASNDNQRPLTGLIAIQLTNNVLTLITSSATNYLYVHKDKIAGDDFYVVVPVEIFSKLVSKLTAENTTLELKDDNLIVTSGGTYTIGVSIDEEGELTRYPDPYYGHIEEFENPKIYPIKKSTLNLILSVNSASVAEGEMAKDLPEVYTGYHMSDAIVTTDSMKMCGVDIKICDEPILVRPETMKLTDVFTEENLNIRISDDKRGNKNIVIDSVNPDCVIVSKLIENMEEFQIADIKGLLDSDFESSCAVSKVKLAQALDRLSLFINKLDDFALYLTFTKDGLKLANKKSSSEEVIAYEASNDFKPYTCTIDINALTDQIKAVPGDLVNIYYGNEVAIKFEDGNITQMIALMS